MFLVYREMYTPTNALMRSVLRRRFEQFQLQCSQFTAQSRCKTTKAHPTRSAGRAVPEGTYIPVPNTVVRLPLWRRLGPLSRAFNKYANYQRSAPYLTQFTSSLVIYSLGDAGAQFIDNEAFDLKRSVRALIIGGVSSIPSYKWFEHSALPALRVLIVVRFMFLGQNFNYSSQTLSLVTKVVVNQLIFTPLFNTYFFGMQNLLSCIQTYHTVNPMQTWEHVTICVPTSWINSCKVWPIITALNFTFTAPQYRNLVASFFAIGWQIYLSLLNKTAEERSVADLPAVEV